MYKILHADEITGSITVEISPLVIVLPVDEDGKVPSGEELDLLIYNCIPPYNENVSQKTPDVKITNWAEIEALVVDTAPPIIDNLDTNGVANISKTLDVDIF